jgi:hypothetical protein
MPTALELSREQWQPYIEAAKKRLVPRELSYAEKQQRNQLLMRLREAAARLKSQFGIQSCLNE